MAVLVAQPELAFVGRGAPREALVQLVGALPVVGMQQPLPRADVRLDFVVGVPEHLLPARRVHDRAGFEVPVPDALLRARERQPKPLFALAQRRLGALAVGDVEVHARRFGRPVRPARAAPGSRATARGRNGRPCGAGGTRLRRSARPAPGSRSARRRAPRPRDAAGAPRRRRAARSRRRHTRASASSASEYTTAPGLEIPVPHAFLRPGEGQREALFALAECRFGAPSRGDVPDGQLHGAIGRTRPRTPARSRRPSSFHPAGWRPRRHATRRGPRSCARWTRGSRARHQGETGWLEKCRGELPGTRRRRGGPRPDSRTRVGCRG